MPDIAPEMLRQQVFGPNSVKIARCWPTVGGSCPHPAKVVQLPPTPADVGQIRSPDSGKIDRVVPKLPNLAWVWRTLFKIGRTRTPANFDQTLPICAKYRPGRPTLVKYDPSPVVFGRYRPNTGQIWAISADLGRISASEATCGQFSGDVSRAIVRQLSVVIVLSATPGHSRDA